MSLLYECINGIIQGGILGESDDDPDREEIASLCVTKLRGMIMVDGDPNRKPVPTDLDLCRSDTGVKSNTLLCSHSTRLSQRIPSWWPSKKM